jgi:hypothetical protein
MSFYYIRGNARTPGFIELHRDDGARHHDGALEVAEIEQE